MEYLRGLVSCLLDRAHPCPTVLYLPTALESPTRPSEHQTVVINRLVSACVERGVIVEYEDSGKEAWKTLFSPTFEAYVVDRRRKAQTVRG